MIYILILYTFLPAWFVGPLPSMQFSPGGPVLYFEGPSLALPLQPTPDGKDRIIVVVDPPAPGPGPYTFGPSLPPPAPRDPPRPRRGFEP